MGLYPSSCDDGDLATGSSCIQKDLSCVKNVPQIRTDSEAERGRLANPLKDWKRKKRGKKLEKKDK
jgi:hypothetical protein